MTEVVQAFERDTGRRFRVFHTPPSLARGMGFLLRHSYPALSSTLGMSAYVANAGDVIERSEVAKVLIPRPVHLRELVHDEVRAVVVERVRVLLRGTGSTLTSYIYTNSPAGEGNQPTKAYAAAFVLLLMVLALNASVDLVARRGRKSRRANACLGRPAPRGCVARKKLRPHSPAATPASGR